MKLLVNIFFVFFVDTNRCRFSGAGLTILFISFGDDKITSKQENRK